MAAFGGNWTTPSGRIRHGPPPKTAMFQTGQAQAKQPASNGTAYRAAAAPASGGAYSSSGDIDNNTFAQAAPAAPAYVSNSNRGYTATASGDIGRPAARPPAPSPAPMFPMPTSFAYQTNGKDRFYNAPSYSADAPNAADYVPHIMPGGIKSRASIMRDATPEQLQTQLGFMMQEYRQKDYNTLNKPRFSRQPTLEDARREIGAQARFNVPTG